MKKSKLTLYIFIALVLGVAVGYVYNIKVIAGINTKINAAEAFIKTSDTQLAGLKDSTTVEYKQLKTARTLKAKERADANATRDDKLEGFTILSDIFLRLIKMIVAPLVFTTLVVGVAKVGDIKAVGRIGGKTLLLFIGATFVSLLLGMLLVNLFQPGSTINLALPDNYLGTVINKSVISLKDFVGHVFPRSFTEAMANNEILQIVVFSLFFGVATASIGDKGEIILKFMDAAAHVIMKITGYVMKLAPIAVFGAITAVVAKEGLGIISAYAAFIGEFYFSLILLWSFIVLGGFIVLKKRVFTPGK
jgi:Na+/H+-dicarboxylate symporter